MDIEGPEDCDLLVIGASLTGAAIARDASGRGLKVCLIERGDLAAKAVPAALAVGSARTAFAEGGLVALCEMQTERERLATIAPHAVRPVRLVTPAAPRGWRQRAKGFIADHLGTRRLLAPPTQTNLRTAPHTGLLHPAFASGLEESDCRLDETRLVVLNCLDAKERGASIRLLSDVIALKRRAEHWEAQVRTPRGEHQINARAIINAAGPETGEVLAMAFPGRAPHAPRLLGEGHLIMPRLYTGAHGYQFECKDGASLTFLPCGRDFTLLSLVGATAASAPRSAAAAAICAAASAFMEAPLAPERALAYFTRLRGVPGACLELTSETAVPPFLTIGGGPLVTHRLRAERAVDLLGAPGRRWTATTPLPGGEIDWLRFDAFISHQQRRWPWLAPHTAARLARTYGTRMARILAGAQSPRDLGTHFGGGLTSAELAYLVTHEFARSAEDILQRTSQLSLTLSAAEQARVADWFARMALTD